jgi:uncharacterized protein YdaU (DUF1376 family)
MPLYIADYLADTAHLSTAEHGAYLLLIMHYWTKGSLPKDEESIRRVTRMTNRQWSQSRDVLRSLFGAEWRHKRCDHEIAQAVEKSRVNSANAKRSHSERSANAQRTHTQSQSQSDKDAVAVEARAGNLVTPEALQLTDKLLVAAGHDIAFFPPGWATAALRVQTWLTQGWAPEIIIATVKRVAARKTGPPANSVNFFENAIAEEVARQAAPLPIVEVKPAETITVKAHGQLQANSVSAVAKRWAEKFERESGDDIEGNPSPIFRLPAR